MYNNIPVILTHKVSDRPVPEQGDTVVNALVDGMARSFTI